MESLPSEATQGVSIISQALAGIVERVGGAVVAVHARERIPSSGIHWRHGAIVTAAHTLKRQEDITVTLADGRHLPATLAGYDHSTDLAALRIEAAGLPTAELGDSSSLKVGSLVLSVGRSGDKSPSATLGVISALGGPWRTWRGGQIERLVRPDLRLYPGFSGSALVDTQGLVVGMNTSGLSSRTGLTLPVSTVHRVTDELLKRGHVSRGFLGLGMHPVRLPDSLRTKLNLAGQSGVIILSVEPEGPADKAGFLLGDVLVALDGNPVAETSDVQAVLTPEYVGKTIPSSLIRGGVLMELAITIGERPRRSE